jgi:hypothetical protein
LKSSQFNKNQKTSIMQKLLFVLACLLVLTAPLLAQDVPTPPTNWGDVFLNPSKWFVDFGAVSLLTAFVATFVIGLLKIVKKFPKQLVAWLVGVVLLVTTDLLNFGYAAQFPILLAIAHGFAAGLAANGLFDIPVLKGLLDALDGWLNSKKPATP